MNNPTRVQQPILFNCQCVPNKKILHVTTQLNHGTRQLQQYPQDFNTESSAHETVHYTVTNSTTMRCMNSAVIFLWLDAEWFTHLLHN